MGHHHAGITIAYAGRSRFALLHTYILYNYCAYGCNPNSVTKRGRGELSL